MALFRLMQYRAFPKRIRFFHILIGYIPSDIITLPDYQNMYLTMFIDNKN